MIRRALRRRFKRPQYIPMDQFFAQYKDTHEVQPLAGGGYIARPLNRSKDPTRGEVLQAVTNFFDKLKADGAIDFIVDPNITFQCQDLIIESKGAS